MRKRRVREHVIADMSLHHLAYIIVSCTFTVEITRSDYGYDLSMFTFDKTGQYENGNVYVQLKATDNIRLTESGNSIRFRIKKRDIRTWESEKFPVYLVVFDALLEKAYALYLQQYLKGASISSATMKKESIEILLPNQVIDLNTIESWRTDKISVLKRMGALTHV
jgi:hypothetical protein